MRHIFHHMAGDPGACGPGGPWGGQGGPGGPPPPGGSWGGGPEGSWGGGSGGPWDPGPRFLFRGGWHDRRFGPRAWAKARRGDVRLAALLLLAEEPRNGYGVMQEIERRSGGVWRPSPGSVYPALAQLEDEGLVRSQAGEAGSTSRTFSLTDDGRLYVEGLPGDRPPPWQAAAEGVSEPHHELAGIFKQVAFAFSQIMQTGTPEQIDAARELLGDTRRRLYGILAEDEGPAPGGVQSDA